MMDEPIAIAQRETKCNFRFRIIELVVCLLCLTIFIVLVCLCRLPTYILAIIIVVAALTTIIVFVSILRKWHKTFHIRWLFIALGSMICYIVCVSLFILLISVLSHWLLYLSMAMAGLAAVVFLIDFIFYLRNILILRKKNTRRNQIMPVISLAVKKSKETLAPVNEFLAPVNENYSTVECSVIIGDQLACNQQLCHVKWSSDQASSTPTAKLIYVQPCNSSVVNKICPACKEINCAQCFRTEENEADTNSVLESQSNVKSTQFPEDDENICPVCTFKAVKVFNTVYVQTSDEHIVPKSTLKPKQENIITRHVHSAESKENQSRANNKLIQSYPPTPRNYPERLMTCSKCQKQNVFMTVIKKNHLCPLCKQICTNKLTCTACYNAVPDPFAEEEISKSPAIQTDEMPTNEESQEGNSKCPAFIKHKIICAKLRNEKMTQVSPEDFQEMTSKVKFNEDKVTQASLSEFIEGTVTKQNICCVCNKTETPKVEFREVETQSSLNEFMEGHPAPHNIMKSEEATNVSSKELLEEMEGKRSAGKTHQCKSCGDQKAELTDNESTQVSSSDFLLFKFDMDKLTQVSSSDFVQRERKPCGVPNCQHPVCAKYKEPIHVIPEKLDEVVQTEPLQNVCPKNKTGKECTSCTVTELVDEETITEQFNKSIASQTTKSLEKVETPQVQELPEDLPECLDPKCVCIINEEQILVCEYCEAQLNNTLSKSSIIDLQPNNQRKSIGIPHKSGCKCGLPTCICCKVHETDELEDLKTSPEKCFCIKTEKGLLKCTHCEAEEKQDRQLRTSGGTDDPIYSSPPSTFQGRNTDEMKSESSHRKSRENEEQKNKCLEVFKNNENEENEDDYASSTCTSETLSTANEFENKYLTPKERKMMYKKEREDMSYQLANKDMDRYTTSSPEPISNITVFTMQKKIPIMEVESKETSDVEKIDDKDDAENDEYTERLKNVWDGLAGKHAVYQDRVRKELESNLKLNDGTNTTEPELLDGSIQILENTQLEMESIYNCMIKNLLERQSRKENNLLFLEKLNDGCDSDAESSKHHTDCAALTEEGFGRERLMAFKGSPFYKFQFPKFDVESQEHIVKRRNIINDNRDDDDDDVLLDINETNTVKISSDFILSNNVSLSTITEEISGTPSDLISSSKESEPSQSKEQLVKLEEEKDLNATYCLKTVNPIDSQPEGTHEKLMKQCNQSCKRDTVYVPLLPCNLQLNKKDKDAEGTPRNVICSAKCKNVSPKSCSARSEKCPKQYAGFFEPFTISQTYGSTKTSFTASDNESVVDSVHQDNMKTLQSTTGSSVSFYLQEDRICSPTVKVVQSQSLPITSRTCVPANEEPHKVFYYGDSIPCTPKKIRWRDTDTQSNSLTDVSKTPTMKSGRSTFRRECDYDEGNETPSMIVIKHFHHEKYESDENRDGAKIVSPLPIADITSEQSESEDSRPISCSSHLSARTLQTIDHYNLECSSSLKKNPTCVHLQEMKKSKKLLSSGMKSQPVSSRAYPIVEKSSARKHDAKFNMEPTVRERRISTTLKCSQRKKSSSPKMLKVKSSTARTFRQKTSALSPYQSSEKRKTSSRNSSARKSRTKPDESVSPEREHVCNCEFYKNSRNNYCRLHGVGVGASVTLSNIANAGSSRLKSTVINTSSSKKNTLPEIRMASMVLSERPKTWTGKSRTRPENEVAGKLVKSEKTSPKVDDT